MRSTSSPRAVSRMTGTAERRRSAAKYLEAVLLGQHHIENDQLVGAAGREIDGAGAGMVGIHLEAFAAQKLADQIAELAVVVDDEDRPGHARSDCPRKGAAIL